MGCVLSIKHGERGKRGHHPANECKGIFQQPAERNVRYDPADFATILVRDRVRTSDDGVKKTRWRRGGFALGAGRSKSTVCSAHNRKLPRSPLHRNRFPDVSPCITYSMAQRRRAGITPLPDSSSSFCSTSGGFPVSILLGCPSDGVFHCAP
jgi:hypothetical protein